MMRSLYAGVSGLQNHQVRMDVLGNNISNVNTNGFKKGRVTFQDMLSQTMSGAAKPTDEVGGVNPKQVGLGMMVASIDTLHKQGALQTTGNMTDVAVQGNGFFIVKDGNKLFYTRSGAFGLDKDGFLVNPANGRKVQGWVAETEEGTTIISTAKDTNDLIIPVGSKDPAAETLNVNFACNLDKRANILQGTEGRETVNANSWITSKDIYDSFGRVHKLEVSFVKDTTQPENPNRWRATVVVDPPADPGAPGAVANPTGTLTAYAGTDSTAGNEFLVEFDNQGALLRTYVDGQTLTAAETPQTGDQLSIALTYNVPDADPPVTQTLNLNIGTVGLYQDGITQFAEKYSTKMFEQDGYAMGYLETFKIDQSGIITGVYSNGTNRELGQIALATFTNPGGLAKAGENTYTESNNSGDANIGTSGVAGRGKIMAGALEMSNVDLAEEFTDMIVTQRGFQANSRTITTSDQMLQELLTLKR